MNDSIQTRIEKSERDSSARDVESLCSTTLEQRLSETLLITATQSSESIPMTLHHSFSVPPGKVQSIEFLRDKIFPGQPPGKSPHHHLSNTSDTSKCIPSRLRLSLLGGRRLNWRPFNKSAVSQQTVFDDIKGVNLHNCLCAIPTLVFSNRSCLLGFNSAFNRSTYCKSKSLLFFLNGMGPVRLQCFR